MKGAQSLWQREKIWTEYQVDQKLWLEEVIGGMSFSVSASTD